MPEISDTNILITRPQPEADYYAVELGEEGFSCLCAPMLSLEGVAFIPPQSAQYQGVLITSAQAVRYFIKGNEDQGFFKTPVYCVGKQSAAAAEAAGFEHIVSVDGTGRDLAAYVASNVQGGGAGTSRYLHIHGRDVAYSIADDLMERGIIVDELVVYEAIKATQIDDDIAARMRGGDIGLVMFFSKRTAEAFGDIIRRESLEDALFGIKTLSISSAVLECVRMFNRADAYVSETPDRAGMLKALKEIYGRE